MSEHDMEILGDSNEITFENAKSFLPRLPLSKAKKIAKMDSEYLLTANAAIVATTFATELFVQSLVENALAMNQLNHNNRNNKKDQNKKNARLTYNDIAESVQRLECFQFLEDVIPKKQSHHNNKNKNIQIKNTTTTSTGTEENIERKTDDEQKEIEDKDEADEVEREKEDTTGKKYDKNSTAEINEHNATNKEHTLSFFQKFQYSANKKSSKSSGSSGKYNNGITSGNSGSKSDVEMIDADDTNSNDDDLVEEIDDDIDDEADEEDSNEDDNNIQEQLSQVEQMDHVVDVDTIQDSTLPSKERMTLNRNQEDNNDLLSSSDSDSETDILRNVV
ncbi:DNA-directed DNA polymerase epsilon, subunit C [Maudiozyma exigua]|uniref:DNA-directed DNA polymerase epsilon, subunit C n=1 Tax=Maudiozyma exigua TaxID=34358 RepID=A0A9P6WDI5_MAUEX|nr:DNA-directed DNA polymerase epsilon, subunit C [Kazachstania exigua]